MGSIDQPIQHGRFRWLICLMLFVVTVSNYIDRQALSIIAPVISAQFHFTTYDIATIVNAFLIAYTFGQCFAGAFMDWIGSRRGMTILVVLWSAASLLTSLSRSVFSFSLFRFFLGLSESGNFAGGIKVVAEWFPIKERSTAVGLFISGASIGAILTPPVVAFLVLHFGWQLAFVMIGVPGFVWIFWWRAMYAPLQASVRVSDAERTYIRAGQDQSHLIRGLSLQSFSFLKYRLFWGVFLGRFIEEPASWFYLTWLPLYLKQFRGVSLMNIGFLLIVPFLTLDIGYMGGGWVSSMLMRSGWSLDRARKTVMFVSAICMVSAIPAVFAESTLTFVGLVSIATLGHGGWAANIMTLPSDMVPHGLVGTVYGITAFGGGLSSIAFMQITGKLVDMQRSFDTVFVVAGILPLVAAVLFLAVSGRIRMLHLPRINEAEAASTIAALS